MGNNVCPLKYSEEDKKKMMKIPGTSYWIKAKENKDIEKRAEEEQKQDPDNFDGNGKIPAIENAFSDPIEKEVAYMIATSHEYKKPNVKAALSFVKNYKWEVSSCKVSDLQGINKPIIPEKVKDMAEKMKGKTPKPLICINQFHGIRPQTPGKKILMDGHHRLEACKENGVTEVPIYKGTYTGKAERSHQELREKTAAHKEEIYKSAEFHEECKAKNKALKLKKKMKKTAELKQKYLAYDFDGTVCENKFPEIGVPKKNVINYIIRKKKEGHKTILWTCRSGKTLKDALKFLKDNSVPVDYINKNPEFDTGSPKIYADEYLDDKAKNVDSVKPQKIASHKMEIEKIATKPKSNFQKLRDNQVPLTPEERKMVMDRKAVWNFNRGGSSPAVWKSVNPKTGEVTFVTNTHRAYAAKPTLKGAISRFHNFIKSTASEENNNIEKTASEQVLYHASPVQDIKKFKRFEDTSGNNKGKIIFATKRKGFAAAFGTRWHDGIASLAIEQKGGEKNKPTNSNFHRAILKVTDDVNLDKPASIYKLKGDFKNMRYDDDLEQYTDKDVDIISEEKYKSFKDLAKENGLEIRNISEKYIESALKRRKSIEKN